MKRTTSSSTADSPRKPDENPTSNSNINENTKPGRRPRMALPQLTKTTPDTAPIRISWAANLDPSMELKELLFYPTEAVFHISACPDDCRVKYATCTLMDSALTWWNNHAKSMGIAKAYDMGWESLKQLMTKEYCPR
uniref:Retrotransposon gag domain-containing protein n=1 Tax=Lactuca sativa TaxID=4236 RepID=A0A9R1UR12_LACSA|nr:hypothetical protein LSAT_V11C800447480 [Lactuca sativa]